MRVQGGCREDAEAAEYGHDLGAVAIRAALERAGVEAPQASEVIMGQILTAGEGQNPARQASTNPRAAKWSGS